MKTAQQILNEVNGLESNNDLMEYDPIIIKAIQVAQYDVLESLTKILFKNEVPNAAAHIIWYIEDMKNNIAK